MDKILICPSERPQVGFLAQSVPLVAVPILGEALLSHWIEFLANDGAKDVLILATDRPHLVRAIVDNGSRWGVRIQVQAELKEPTVEEAASRFPVKDSGRTEHQVVVIDHLPGLEKLELFASYREWFAAVVACMTGVLKLNRIGVREIQPQVWCGRRTHIEPSARIQGPCWIGNQVRIGRDAIIGPDAVLEDGVVVDSASEIRSSVIGPDTFVGALTRVEDSIAWGSTLINWRTGSCTQVPDPFLLCALRQRSLATDRRSLMGRLRGGVGQLFARPWAMMTTWPGKLRQ